MASSEATDITLFTEVDRTAEPDFYVRFLNEGNALPSVRTPMLSWRVARSWVLRSWPSRSRRGVDTRGEVTTLRSTSRCA